MVTLRPDPGTIQICPFVSKGGCRVYPNRPSSCRIYPLARAISRNRKTGRISEHFALLKESHCHGHEDGKTWTVAQWMTNQELGEYNRINDQMMALVSLKNQHHPGPLSLVATRMFYLACYDLDRFREQILENGLIDDQKIDSGVREQLAEDDLLLLQFGMDWIKCEIFLKR